MKKNLETKTGRKKLPVKKQPDQPKPPREYVLVLGKVLLLPLLCCLSLFASATVSRDTAVVKEHVIKGKVTDERKEPMPGVTVILEGTSVGVTTDVKGEFELRLPKGEGTLVFSFVGYKTVRKQIPLDNRIVQVCLVEDISKLDEVTVVAYGTQRKRDVVGAMSVVKGEDIKDVPSPSFINLLQGRVAGMDITNMTGAPGGGGIAVSIRGYSTLAVEKTRRFSDPLYVIDGIPMLSYTSPVTGTSAIAEIDPNDIESIQVLKDAASAAIYGSRAANGVVIITTKSGKAGQTRVSVDFSRTISFDPALPVLTGGNAERYHRLEALKNFRQAYYDYATNTHKYVGSCKESYDENLHYNYFWNKGDGSRVPPYQDSLNPFYNNSTNLFKYYFRTAKVTNVNVQLNGGTSFLTYNVGIGYYDESGVLRNTGFSRVKLIGNFLLKPFEKLESNLRFYIACAGRKRASRFSNAYTGFTEGEDLEQIPEELLKTSTILPGEGTAAFEEMIKRFNTIKEKNESYRLRASFDLGYEFVRGMKLKSSVSADYSQQNQNLFMPADLDDYGETYSSGAITRNLMLLNENLLTYNHTFNEAHVLDMLAGASFQVDEMQSVGGWGKGAPSDLIHYVSWNGNVYDSENNRALKDFLTGKERSTMVGLFGRVNYNYLQKYFAAMTVRRDASSKFGENVRWGTFPSFAVAWTFSEEGFMDWSRGVLDHGKIRLSYGKSGRQFDQPYISQGLLQPGNPFLGNPSVDPDLARGLANRELTWEETKQYDFGLDLDMLDHRLNVVVDYYYRYTDKLIYPVPLAGDYSSFYSQWQNAYTISNEGIEFDVKYDVIRKDYLTWNVGFNIARNWNRLEKSQSRRDFQTENSKNNLNVIGKALNGIYVFKTRGLYNKAGEVSGTFINGKYTSLGGSSSTQFYRPGDRVIVDVDGNGSVTADGAADDRVYAGSPLPLASGGITSSLSWKGFDLNVLFHYVIGRHILNAASGSSVGTALGMTVEDITKPVFEDLNNVTFWREPGDKADYPANRLEAGLNNFATNIDANVEKVNYLKLKVLSLSYTLPGSVTRKLGCGLRFYVSGENLFTFTNYSGSDPESVNISTGIDNASNYPLMKKVTFGLTLTLKK